MQYANWRLLFWPSIFVLPLFLGWTGFGIFKQWHLAVGPMPPDVQQALVWLYGSYYGLWIVAALFAVAARDILYGRCHLEWLYTVVIWLHQTLILPGVAIAWVIKQITGLNLDDQLEYHVYLVLALTGAWLLGDPLCWWLYSLQVFGLVWAMYMATVMQTSQLGNSAYQVNMELWFASPPWSYATAQFAWRGSFYHPDQLPRNNGS